MSAPFITGRVIGAEQVERHFAVLAPQRAQQRVRVAIRTLGLSLQRKVVGGTLAGGVLNRRTGRAARSVNTRFSEQADVYSAFTGSKLRYLVAWERGFHVPAREIQAVNAQALFWPGAQHPVRSVSQPARDQAARPWLKPALEGMRPTIRATLARAVRGL